MTKRYWGSVSDAHLLAVELTTDNPEKLDNLTAILPQGPEEPFVEYAYDLRKSEHGMMRCTHCHQLHLAGVVINKAGQRFLVGHICGDHIYGATFAIIKKDFDTAVDRQNTLRRVREVRAVVDPFLEWMENFSQSEVFKQHETIRAQFQKNMPWLWQQLQWHTNSSGGYVGGVKLPNTLFDGFTDPQHGFMQLAADISRLAMLVVGKIEIEKDIGGTFGRLQVLLSRVEGTVKQLEEVEQFFHPTLLGKVCEWATRDDGKRKYDAGLMSITCIRDKSRSIVCVPATYKVPDTGPIAAFRAAVSNLPAK